jgi:hypothetical protein
MRTACWIRRHRPFRNGLTARGCGPLCQAPAVWRSGGAAGGIVGRKGCENRGRKRVDHCAKGGRKTGAVVVVGALVGSWSGGGTEESG